MTPGPKKIYGYPQVNQRSGDTEGKASYLDPLLVLTLCAPALTPISVFAFGVIRDAGPRYTFPQHPYGAESSAAEGRGTVNSSGLNNARMEVVRLCFQWK